MAKNAVETAIKSRQTKLTKKSSEELIQIILRKDKTERNLNAQVANLKAEVNSLTSRVNSFNKDLEGTLKELVACREESASLRKKRIALEKDNDEIKDKYRDTVQELSKELSLWKNITFIVGIIAVIAISICFI